MPTPSACKWEIARRQITTHLPTGHNILQTGIEVTSQDERRRNTTESAHVRRYERRRGTDRADPLVFRRKMSTRDLLNGKSLVIHVPDLSGGGAERLQLDLAPLFMAAGLKVTFLLGADTGVLQSQIPPGAEVVSLNAHRQLMSLIPIARYLRRTRPDILVVNTEHPAILALWARRIARSATRVLVCQHNTLSAQGRRPGWQFRMLPSLARLSFPQADRIVAVSLGVADDLAVNCGIPRGRIDVIYNGVVGSDFARKKAARLEHRWFGQGMPVVVAAGRFVDQKDFATLITAFKRVLETREARLLLLGDGPLRETLLAQVRSLGIAECVDMPGFCANPVPFLNAASVVVLSSRYEGFGMVLAEALACGTPVVSTDCPHGPAEILEHGRYGRLTPVGDPDALARAILATLSAPPPRDVLQARGNLFSVTSAADQYLALFRVMLSQPQPS
jgi:glycosyltransferase involved in cell wall biosynthesis